MRKNEPIAIKKAKKSTNHRTKAQLLEDSEKSVVLVDQYLPDTQDSKAVYSFFQKNLQENGIWWPSDAISLELYVELIKERNTLTEKIKNVKNDERRWKLVRERHTILADALEYEKQMGLTLLARSNLMRKQEKEKPKKTVKDEAIDLM